MAGWFVVFGGCLACFVLKLTGYLAPSSRLERPRTMRIAALLSVSLLSALVALQTLVTGREPAVDARVPAVAVAAVLLWRRAPFVVVVLSAAVVAAVLRLL